MVIAWCFFLYDNSIYWSSYLDCKISLRNLRFDMPIHHNGVIHFISYCSPYFQKSNPYFSPYIMSCNFEDGKSRMLRVPKESRKVVEKDRIVKGFVLLNGDLLVFATKKKVYAYCLTNMRICEFCEHGFEFMVHFVSQSLYKPPFVS
ncbi:hypothetical protein CR513_33795, partial [Mucuna pruriens]